MINLEHNPFFSIAKKAVFNPKMEVNPFSYPKKDKNP